MCESARSSAIYFEVEDTGVGIDAAALPHLFEPFTQADSSTSRRFGEPGWALTFKNWRNS